MLNNSCPTLRVSKDDLFSIERFEQINRANFSTTGREYQLKGKYHFMADLFYIAALLMWNQHQLYLFPQIQTSRTGVLHCCRVILPPMVSVLRHWLSLYLNHLLYPIDECEDSRINSKVVWLSASDAPADDPDNFDATAMVCLTDERSTGVTLNQCVKILQVYHHITSVFLRRLHLYKIYFFCRVQILTLIKSTPMPVRFTK